MATAGGLLSGLTGNLSSVVVQPGGWVGDEGWNAAGARALGLEMEAKDGRAIIARIGHGSPAMLCGGIAVGDEVVSIDGFPVTPDLSLFARRAAAGVKDSLVQLTLRHSSSGDAENKHGEHDVVLLRAETIEPAPVLYTEATNDAIGPTSVAAAALVTPQAGLGIVVGVSVVADPSFVRDRKGMTELESTSQDVVIKDIPVGSAVWKHTCKLVCISILHAICMHIGLASLVFMCAYACAPSQLLTHSVAQQAHISGQLQVGDMIECVNGISVKGQTFNNVVKSFVGPVSTRIFLTIRRKGYSHEVSVVRHNRLTSPQAHARLEAVHARLAFMTIHATLARRAEKDGAGAIEMVAESLALSFTLRRVGTGEWVIKALAEANGQRQDAVEDETPRQPEEGCISFSKRASQLMEGDVLCEVDGRAMKDLKVFDVLYLLDGPASNDTAKLKVYR